MVAYATNHQFLDYLTELTDNNHESYATENIVNQFGVLLVPSGEKITRSIADTIKQHKLPKPFDLQLGLDNCKSEQELFQDLIDLLDKHHSLLLIHYKEGYEGRLEAYLTQAQIPLSVRQKLTVMAHVLPHLYQEALLVCWLSGLIGEQLKLEFSQIQNLCLAALFHDLGFVFLAPELSMQQRLNEQQVRMMQAHVKLGKVILEIETGVDSEIIQAVMEHHERLDRTGYPTRKPGHQLGLFGQIINCSNLAYDIYIKDVVSKDFPVSMVAPFLRIHTGAYQPDVVNAIINVFRKYHLSLTRKTDDNLLAGLQELVQSLNRTIKSLRAVRKSLSRPVLECHKASVETQLVINYVKLEDMLKQTGIDKEEFDWVISDLTGEGPEELFELYALHREVLWLYKRTAWNIRDTIKDSTRLTQSALKQLTESEVLISQYVEQAWTDIERFSSGGQSDEKIAS